MLADQMLSRIEYVHSKSFLHRFPPAPLHLRKICALPETAPRSFAIVKEATIDPLVRRYGFGILLFEY